MVSSGLYRAIFVHEAKKKARLLWWWKRCPNITGNVYTTKNIEGIDVYVHGAHIFHKNNKKVWDYIT